MGNNILIINYVFPPYPGIGGRRWAKFSKYLYRKGNNVYVIASKNPFKNISTFTNDIKELPKENLFYLNPKYPTVLLRHPENITDKLQYHFWIKVLPLLTQGNFYDRSVLWKKQLQEKIRWIVDDKNIDTIIISGPPFHYAYETMLLKKVYPHIKFIVDYRDEWTFNDVHGFGIIGDKRRKVEYEKEKLVCENADAVISCHQKVLDYLNERYAIKKFRLITHGFDKDDFLGENFDDYKNYADNISLCFFGTMEPYLEDFFNELNLSLSKIQTENPELYDKIKFKFYLISEFQYKDLINKHLSLFEFEYNLSAKELFKKIRTVNYILIFLPNWVKDYFTTKFPEIFFLQKPIILYSEDGRVGEFVKQHNIGIHLPKENFYNALVQALKNPQHYNYADFPIHQWEYSYITDQLLELIDSL